MGMTVSFGAKATPQEKAEAKASAKASLLGTALTAASGAVVGGAIGTAVSFMPCKPAIEKVLDEARVEGSNSSLKSIAQDFFDKHTLYNNALKADIITKDIASKEAIPNKGQDIIDAIAAGKEELKKLPNPEKLEEFKKSYDNACKLAKEKAEELIKNASESDLIKKAKKATKSMNRPNLIASGVRTGIMIALLYNIISSFRKPKEQDPTKKSFQA